MSNSSEHMPEFAIIGASPSGLSFALSLLQLHPTIQPHDIHIYEANAAGRRPGGPFSLMPNALRILSKLRIGDEGACVYDLVKDLGFQQIHHTMRDDHGKFLGSLPMGSESRWGFNALRIERGEVLKVLEAEVQRLGIQVYYAASLRSIECEDHGSVKFTVRHGRHDSVDLRRVTARYLIGADGIHSRTRTFVCGQEVKPKYSGQFMSAAYIPSDKIKWGPRFAESREKQELSLSITGSRGTMMVIPANSQASVMQVGRQWAGPEQTRAGWEAMASDRASLLRLFQLDQESWSDLPRSILDTIRPEDIWGVWPFYAVPKLERWVSPAQQRVIIIGDAAHTVVPAAAQGATQAIEDAWTLAQAFSSQVALPGALNTWQQQRMARLERISTLSVQLMNIRLPPAEQVKLDPDMIFDLTGDVEAREERFDWLYAHKFD